MNVLSCPPHCAPGVRQNSSPQSKSPIGTQLFNCAGQVVSPEHGAALVVGVALSSDGIVTAATSGCCSSRGSGGVVAQAASAPAIARIMANPLTFMEAPPDGLLPAVRAHSP